MERLIEELSRLLNDPFVLGLLVGGFVVWLVLQIRRNRKKRREKAAADKDRSRSI